VADEAVLNIVHKNIKKAPLLITKTKIKNKNKNKNETIGDCFL
jgi:hypothetical protein